MFQNISGNFTIENIEESINAIDEPYSDPSIVPAYLISKKMAKLYSSYLWRRRNEFLEGNKDIRLLKKKIFLTTYFLSFLFCILRG